MDNLKRPVSHSTILDNGIAQIALVVKDLDQTVEDYWRTFGIGPWHFYTYKRPLLGMSRYYGKDADNALRIALSYFGPTRIELIEVKQGPSLQEDFILEHGYGVQHLGIGSDLCQDQPDTVVQWMRTGIWNENPERDAATIRFPAQPSWFRNNLSFPGIAVGLRAVGFSDQDVRGIMGENWLRFFDHAFRPMETSDGAGTPLAAEA